MTYTEGTIRRKAYNIGYQIQKGFQHFGRFVYRDSYGDRYTGYMVRDLRTGFYEWGCYDSNFDHLWDLVDVADLLCDRILLRRATIQAYLRRMNECKVSVFLNP